MVAAGSTVDWTLSGTDGDCSVYRSGTLDVANLDGDLTVVSPKSGEWVYTLDVGPRHGRSSADRVMPYTAVCPNETVRQRCELI